MSLVLAVIQCLLLEFSLFLHDLKYMFGTFGSSYYTPKNVLLHLAHIQKRYLYNFKKPLKMNSSFDMMMTEVTLM